VTVPKLVKRCKLVSEEDGYYADQDVLTHGKTRRIHDA